jgi:hypothetical protein
MPNIKNMDFSTDGISWTSAFVNVSLFPDEKIFEQGVVENDITSIDNTNYIWGAVGKNGLILKSSQLNDSLGTFNPVYNKHTQLWNNITTSSNFGTGFIQSVSHGNGLWVAVAGAGLIRSSTDAITWTTQTSNFGNTNIQSVAYGNGLWVIGGVAGQLRTSTDNLINNLSINNISNINSEVFITSNSGIISKYDSVSNIWNHYETGITDNFVNIAKKDSTYVLEGQNAIYSSPNLITWTTISGSGLTATEITDIISN